jgi:riboflavin synthase
MFTGLIEELGVVASFVRGAQSAKLIVAVSKELTTAKVGESIAVNGVCLTVTAIRRNFIEFDLSLETINKSTLANLRISDKVNLERALPVAGRLGGHLVSGHIDGIGEIREKIALDKGFEFYFSLPSNLLRYLVPKGSIAIDGISLTVADLRNDHLVVYVIPHTSRATNLTNKKIGDKVNIEIDMLSKYIEKHLQRQMGSASEGMMNQAGYLPLGWIDN